MALPSRLPLPQPLLRNVAARLLRRLGAHPKAAGLLQFGGTYAGAYLLQRGLYLPDELGELLDPEIIAQGLGRLMPLELIKAQLDPLPRTPFARVATLESALYLRNQLLRDTDWASMAHSLEVRVPLVDSVLLATLAPLAAQGRIRGKALLACAPSRPLPRAVTRRGKTGFTTPVATWMKARVVPDNEAARPVPWARGWSKIVGEQIHAGV